MRADVAIATFLLSLFVVAAHEATSFPWQAAIAPLLSAGAGIVLATLLVFGLLLGRSGLAASPDYGVADARAYLGFLLAVASVLLLGFKVGGAVFVFLYLWRVARRSLVQATLAATSVPLFVMVLIEGALGARLFPGLAFATGGW